MNLVIDIGNTRTKFALFNRGEMVISVPVDEFLPSHIDILKNEYPGLDQAIISSVKGYPAELATKMQGCFDCFVQLGPDTPLPIGNDYKTKETLGNDRLAAAVGANYLYPSQNILIIDAGTAITYDLVSANNRFLGGNISPGIEMRFKSLHAFTGKLPLVCLNNEENLLGDSTEKAIRAGVQNGVIYEVEQTINAFKENYKNLQVIITGGDAIFFDKKLKSSFFVNFNLVAIGLNRILEYNKENK